MNGRVDHIAELITDGIDVDWAAESSDGAIPEARLEPLRMVEIITRFHRSAPVPLDDLAEATLETTSRPGDAAPGSAESRSPGDRWGALKIRERLGAGAFGEVYRAFDPQLRREVALKLLKTENMEQILSEGRSLARVRHPNVLVAHGVAEHDGRVGLWTDLLKGQDLREIVSQNGPLGPQEAALIGIDLCRALAALHQTGLVHRDIKPSNVMREEGGRIVLLDFGASCDPNLIADGTVQGTPMFIAPEIWRGRAKAGVGTDIYALGVLLFWLVTGEYPIQSKSVAGVRSAHEAGRGQRLRDVRADLPTAFVQAVDGARASDPARRCQSAGELEHQLARMLTPVEEREAPASQASGRWSVPWLRAAAVERPRTPPRCCSARGQPMGRVRRVDGAVHGVVLSVARGGAGGSGASACPRPAGAPEQRALRSPVPLGSVRAHGPRLNRVVGGGAVRQHSPRIHPTLKHGSSRDELIEAAGGAIQCHPDTA